MDAHDPQVLAMVDIADRWVVRCDCGCELFEQYARREEAEDRAAAIRADDAGPSERAQAAEAAVTEGIERI